MAVTMCWHTFKRFWKLVFHLVSNNTYFALTYMSEYRIRSASLELVPTTMFVNFEDSRQALYISGQTHPHLCYVSAAKSLAAWQSVYRETRAYK